MKIKGEIVHQRCYKNMDNRELWLTFLRVAEGIVVDGLRIHYLPILRENKIMNYQIDDSVVVTGIVKYQRIITPLGHLSKFPIPVIIPIDTSL